MTFADMRPRFERFGPRRFLVTGAAGFIGSHLVEALLKLGQSVVGLDNFANGTRSTVSDTIAAVGPSATRFRFIEGDIRDKDACAEAMACADVVFHQAALASVPRSIEDPDSFHSVNVHGFSTVLSAARAAGVQRIVYASSSSVYGDDAAHEKTEDRTGRPLSPYAATKLIGEVQAGTFQRTSGVHCVGLRYFNVFGPRQNPAGPYAAVIPRWILNLLGGAECVVFGDGSASRDFCYVDNVVQANLLAATADDSALTHDVFNIACGERTRLLELFDGIRTGVAAFRPEVATATLRFDPPRAGDIPHSLASIARAQTVLGYSAAYDVWRGLSRTIAWYALRQLRTSPPEFSGTMRA